MKAESALIIQGRVLFALVMREMATRYGRSAGGYVWAVLEPAATVALLTAVFAQIVDRPPLGDSFTVFYATGYMAFHVYKDVSTAVSNAVKSNKALLMLPRITILDTVIARFALQVLTSLFVTIAVLAAALALTGEQIALRLQPAFAALSMAAALGLAVGALNCLLFAYSQTWQRTFNLINRPLFLISGVFFLMEAMPRWIQDALWWNPLVHLTALMRQAFYPMYDPDFVSPAYVCALSGGVLFLAILLLRRLEGRILEQ